MDLFARWCLNLLPVNAAKNELHWRNLTLPWVTLPEVLHWWWEWDNARLLVCAHPCQETESRGNWTDGHIKRAVTQVSTHRSFLKFWPHCWLKGIWNTLMWDDRATSWVLPPSPLFFLHTMGSNLLAKLDFKIEKLILIWLLFKLIEWGQRFDQAVNQTNQPNIKKAA